MEERVVRESLIELWKKVFGDTDEYVRLVFDNYFNLDLAEYEVINGKIVAGMIGIPYDFIVDCASTHPQIREFSPLTHFTAPLASDVYHYDFQALQPHQSSQDELPYVKGGERKKSDVELLRKPKECANSDAGLEHIAAGQYGNSDASSLLKTSSEETLSNQNQVNDAAQGCDILANDSEFLTHKSIINNSDASAPRVGAIVNSDDALAKERDVIKGVYLCGLSTLPEYRNRGIMSRMIDRFLVKLERLNYDFAFLIPAEKSLVQYYNDRGFINTTYKATVVYELLKFNNKPKNFNTHKLSINEEYIEIITNIIDEIYYKNYKSYNLNNRNIKSGKVEEFKEEILKLLSEDVCYNNLNFEQKIDVENLLTDIFYVYDLLNCRYAASNNYGQIFHNFKDTFIVLYENYLSGGAVFLHRNPNSEPDGVMICTQSNDAHLDISFLFSESRDVENEIHRSLKYYYPEISSVSVSSYLSSRNLSPNLLSSQDFKKLYGIGDREEFENLNAKLDKPNQQDSMFKLVGKKYRTYGMIRVLNGSDKQDSSCVPYLSAHPEVMSNILFYLMLD